MGRLEYHLCAWCDRQQELMDNGLMLNHLAAHSKRNYCPGSSKSKTQHADQCHLREQWRTHSDAYFSRELLEKTMSRPVVDYRDDSIDKIVKIADKHILSLIPREAFDAAVADLNNLERAALTTYVGDMIGMDILLAFRRMEDRKYPPKPREVASFIRKSEKRQRFE